VNKGFLQSGPSSIVKLFLVARFTQTWFQESESEFWLVSFFIKTRKIQELAG